MPARTRLGIGMNDMLSGPVPFKLTGRVASRAIARAAIRSRRICKDSKITELLPGWWKAAGRATRVTFTVIDKPQVMRFDDIVIEGPGTLVKGMIELDANGEIALASFPSFALSDGDKATLRADRAPDGTLKVTMRGELFDGRGFIKSATSGPPSREGQARSAATSISTSSSAPSPATTSRRCAASSCACRGATATSAISACSPSSAAMPRSRAICAPIRAAARSIYLESNDAGALLRFTDIYSRVVGGQMWMAMDPPTTDQPAAGRRDQRARLLDPRRSRAAARRRDRRRSERPHAAERFGAGVSFSRMRAEFTRSPGKLAVRDGVVWGPAMGATLEGQFDYRRDDVRLRGTFVPAYALNNFLARVPIVGLFLGGGQNEGVFGMTYEVVGPQGNATLRVDPMSMLAPGYPAQDLRIPRRRERPQRRAAVFLADDADRLGTGSYTGFSSTCFLRPSESLMTPSGVRSFSDSAIFSSVTVASLTFSPPPLI